MKAKGKMFWDDGEKMDSFENGFYQINTFDFSQVRNDKKPFSMNHDS
jgi:hypothetical protein